MNQPNIVTNISKQIHKINQSTQLLRLPLLRDIPMSALLFLSSRAMVLGMFPFGIALFASCFDKKIAYMGIITMCLALISTGSRIEVVKYLIAALLFWLFTSLRTSSKENKIIESITCGISVFVGGLAVMMYNFIGVYDLLILVIECIIASFMYIIFYKAYMLIQNRSSRTQAAQDEVISIAICVGVFITGMSDIILPYSINLSHIVSVYSVMCISLHSSLAAAGSGGVCLGFISAMSTPSAIITMGIFGISAIFGNFLKTFGKYGVGIGFLGGIAVSLLYIGNVFDLPLTITEAAIGAFLFMLTPMKVHGYMGAFFKKSLKIESVSIDVRLKEYISMQLERSAKSFKSLEDCFSAVSDKRLKTYNKDAAAIFDEVADRVCDGCANAQKCWGNNFNSTYRSFMGLLEEIETNGVLKMNSLPFLFREKCLRPEMFIIEFNHIYEMYKKNKVNIGEAVMSRDLIAQQYNEMAELMNEMSQEISRGFTFLEDAEEEIIEELDKFGVVAMEVSAVENETGKLEVYLGITVNDDLDKVEGVLTNVLQTPMGYDCQTQNGLFKFVSKPKFTADIGTAQIAKDGNSVCGDCLTMFTTDNYKLYVIISDGMGSGRSAMAESGITLDLLKEFLQAGFSVKTAINMVNSTLCLKLDKECFSTIDLVSIDLMTGLGEFFKIGSAQSIIYKGKSVETVFSVSLPVGMLPSVKVENQAKKFDDGDIILMMSDGVTEAGFGTVRTEWIKKQIKLPYQTMDSLADNIINIAAKKNKDNILDDMTVVAVRLIET